VAHTYNPNNPSYLGGRQRSGASQFEASPWQIVHQTVSLKRAGRMAQVIESLHSKCEALSSNPSTTKKKKKKQEEENGE
jgi:hypothetical protein